MKRFYLAIAAASLMAVAACTSTQPGSGSPAVPPTQAPVDAEAKSAPAGNFNDVDVMFLQMMIPHHAQGMEMVQLAAKNAARQEIKDLVAAIELTQADEAKNMTAWLRQWGKPTTADPHADAHVNHGGLPATNPEVIADLAKASGSEFESKFLNLFTGHQGAAVEMAQREVKQGASQPVKELADRIVKSRSGQIQQMLTLLGQQ
ncbi:DUF305 domain-containing protein [Kibdelosporangium philippinense]|uniref:DUF305 domain-containing protein n=1 Tax=Kibdelosporangium philippinense TaxID=211113 RepID=A0ABS8ZAT5_9PSEU|nr:DUF305 domain-containing protein [Kibdelosporangium philippinense]MCE7002937.1 DUF305 domain-containing protein [Kibdelosporangium philippinense]